MITTRGHYPVAFAALLAGASLFAGAVAAQTELSVYSAVEAEDLKKYADRFNEDHPDIKINWTRDSTGVVTAKLLAEKNNPQADVVWGLAATSLLLLKTEGMLEPYAPKGVESINAKFRDSSNPPAWVGMDAWAGAICFNTVEAAKHNIPAPTTWADLVKPEYKGYVVMPNPASSGTGFLDVSSWIQMMGDEKAWQYMDKLHDNVAAYTHSGSKPCKMAGSGETVVGISFEFRGAKEKSGGAPIDVITPSDGIGWDMEAAAIMAGTEKLEAAKTLLDWAVSRKAMEMYNEGYAVVAMDGVAKKVEHVPDNLLELMIDNNFEWAANNRKAILEEWSRRYDAKSEPKS